MPYENSFRLVQVRFRPSGTRPMPDSVIWNLSLYKLHMPQRGFVKNLFVDTISKVSWKSKKVLGVYQSTDLSCPEVQIAPTRRKSSFHTREPCREPKPQNDDTFSKLSFDELGPQRIDEFQLLNANCFEIAKIGDEILKMWVCRDRSMTGQLVYWSINSYAVMRRYNWFDSSWYCDETLGALWWPR